MRQRVVIALALCSRPDLIIADEPTTALDVSVQAQILELIRDLAQQHKVGIILVTHDMGVISQTADRVAVMYHGKLVEMGPTKEIIHNPQHAYTQSLIAAVPRGDLKLERFPRVSYSETGAQEQEEFNLSSHWLGAAGEVPTTASDEPLVRVENLGIRFPTVNAILPRQPALYSGSEGRQFLISNRAKCWDWWGNPAAANPLSPVCFQVSTSPTKGRSPLTDKTFRRSRAAKSVRRSAARSR